MSQTESLQSVNKYLGSKHGLCLVSTPDGLELLWDVSRDPASSIVFDTPGEAKRLVDVRWETANHRYYDQTGAFTEHGEHLDDIFAELLDRAKPYNVEGR